MKNTLLLALLGFLVWTTGCQTETTTEVESSRPALTLDQLPLQVGAEWVFEVGLAEPGAEFGPLAADTDTLVAAIVSAEEVESLTVYTCTVTRGGASDTTKIRVGDTGLELVLHDLLETVPVLFPLELGWEWEGNITRFTASSVNYDKDGLGTITVNDYRGHGVPAILRSYTIVPYIGINYASETRTWSDGRQETTVAILRSFKAGG